MTSISPYASAGDQPAGQARPLDETNQRESWLRQMELALMAELNQSRNARHAVNGRLHTSSEEKVSAFDADSDADKRHGPSPDSSWHSERGAHLSNASHDTSAGSSATNGELGRDTAKRDVENAASSRGSATHSVSPASHPGVQEAGDHRPRPADDGNAANESGAAMLAASLSSASGALRLAATQALYSADESVVTSNKMPAPSSLMGGSMPTQQSANEASTQETDGAAASEGAPQDKPTWQKKMLHITTQGDDAHVWIRDAALDPAMSSALVARLADDLAQMGLRMSGATINGKAAVRASQFDEIGASANLITINETDTDGRHPAISNEEQRHGA